MQAKHVCMQKHYELTKNMKKINLPIAILAVAFVAGAGAGLAGLASAQTISPTTSTATSSPPTKGFNGFKRGVMNHGRGRGTSGTVTAVNGSQITLTDSKGTSYTVDAGSAKISKISTITTGDIKVGDTLGVMGTVSGNTVTAKQIIMDGALAHPGIPSK